MLLGVAWWGIGHGLLPGPSIFISTDGGAQYTSS